MFDFFRNENPDIACFQEYFNNTEAYFPVHNSLISNQQFTYSHNYYNIQIKNGHQFGIATYSTFPIINKQELLFKNTNNLAIISDIKIENDTIRVLTYWLHFV
ncbi:MAG: hypothetical protein PF517_01180 [Salinivirgaceae bacterium]|jgi:hypothetical protein|nr:hypothetical protein [Salinivirgaceae bacterium]